MKRIDWVIYGTGICGGVLGIVLSTMAGNVPAALYASAAVIWAIDGLAIHAAGGR